MSLLAELTLKVSVVIAAALTAVVALRGRPAALRHWLLTAAILCAAATPFLERLAPVWQWPFNVASTTPFAGAPSSDATVHARFSPSSDVTVGRGHQLETPLQNTARRFGADWIVPLWIAGAAVTLIGLALGLLRLTWLASRSRSVSSGAWREICDLIASRYGLRRRVRLLQSQHPTLLVTWGARTPKIILPAGAERWSRERITVVIAHELAHASRNDWVVQLSGELMRAIYWFNPLLWIACRQLRRESELASDDEVLGLGVEPREYATHLVTLAREMRARRGFWIPAPAIVGRSYFERRITAMLNRDVNRMPLTAWRRAAVALTILAATIGIAAAQSPYARLSGVVADPRGGSIADVVVTATHAATNTRHEVHTNATGAFEFVGLQAGEYALDAVAPGFGPYRETLTLSPGQILPRGITLQLGLLQETLTIVAGDERPVVRTANRGSNAARQSPCIAAMAGGQLRPPTKITDVRPVYPANLRATRVEGKVELEATIGVDGTVTDVHAVSSPDADLTAAAMDAVRRWEFTPTLLNCVPVEARMAVSALFRAAQ